MTDTSARSRQSTTPKTAAEQQPPAPPTPANAPSNEAILLDALQSGEASVLAFALNVGMKIKADDATMDLPPASYAIVMLHRNPSVKAGLYEARAARTVAQK